MLVAVVPLVARVQERILAPLTEAEREIFVRLLDRVTEVNNDVTSAPLRRIAEVAAGG